jgi:hypothetical protein
MQDIIESQIKERVSSFVQELDLLVRKSALEALRGVLVSGAAPARRGRPAGSGRGPGRPKGSGRSGNVDEPAARIVAHVRSNDGQGISAIAQATGVHKKVAKAAALKLIASGELKKSGKKRGTVYHIGSGRKPRAKAGKRGVRKAKRAARKATKAKRKPKVTKAAVIIPAPKRKPEPALRRRPGKKYDQARVDLLASL